jgi:hypothetical protein
MFEYQVKLLQNFDFATHNFTIVPPIQQISLELESESRIKQQKIKFKIEDSRFNNQKPFNCFS